MNNCKVFKLIIILVLLVTVETYSQNSLRVHFGIANPLSDFASDDINDEDAAGADIGMNIGLKFTHQLSDNGFGLYTSIDYNYNELKNDVKDVFERLLPNTKYTLYNYHNIPISGGLNYTFDDTEKLRLFGNAGLVLNLLKISDFVVETNSGEGTTEFNLTYGIGFKVGGGIIINKITSISIDYMGLGRHDINGKVNTGGMSSEKIDAELKVDIITLTLGIIF